MLVGAALAARDGYRRPGLAFLFWLFAGCVQIGTNLHNDYEDFRKGADTDARLGPARATQRGWLSPREVRAGAMISFALATLCGVYLTWLAGPAIIGIGLASLVAALKKTDFGKHFLNHKVFATEKDLFAVHDQLILIT